MNWDIEDGWKLLQKWILSGRLGRRSYAEVVILTFVAGLTVVLTPLFIIFILPDFNSDFLELPITAVGIAVAIIMVVVYSAASVARLRDMGYSTNWFIAGLIPYLNILFFIILALTEGKIAKEKRLNKTAASD